MKTHHRNLRRWYSYSCNSRWSVQSTSNLQHHLNLIPAWIHTWKIKINETKSIQVNFTLRRGQCPQVTLNNNNIPQNPSVKYLGIHLDSRFIWKKHVTKKPKQIDLRTKELNRVIGRRSSLSLENKVRIYKTITKPIWIYWIELWGCASKSSISIIQRSHSKILRIITKEPWYVNNQTLHTELNIPASVTSSKKTVPYATTN
jgi:hypothetical protein